MVREKPPSSPKTGEKKKRARSKSVKRAPSLSPFQQRLKETEFYTQPEFDKFLALPTVKDRLLLINSLLSDDVTDIVRAWPLQLKTKDSRLRRELSDQGKECFVRGEVDKVLEYYNKALLYSTGKGVAHTLARRAAFFLSTDDQKLAVRDLSVALEYGGLETELLDFLLVHHTTDEEKIRAKNEASIENAINTMKNAKLDMQNATTSDISKWADEIRVNLSKAAKLRKNDPGSRKIKDNILKSIINSVKEASKETNLDENIEIDELEVPTLTEKNPLCPAFSEAAAIAFDPDKGRIVRARRAIKAGEMICVDDPVCSMLCPDNKESLLNHCLSCFRYTKAPLPCDNCCSVVFCSKKCKDFANQTFHRIECQLKLYELFEYEGREVFSLFMALRAITQKPLHYFTENQKEIEKFLDLEEPTFPFPGRAYQSSDYRALCNLMTHVGDIDGDVAVKNSVLSVFFLRFIQKCGYFSKTGKLRGDKSLGSTETFILRVIHQVICAQAFNQHSVHKITRSFQWERIGTAINPSLALVNHSCDSNALRCNVNKSSILVAARHIPEGEEITETYYGHFRDTSRHQREYYTLKNYMFECECSACKENWPQEGEIPDELFRVPNFEQEKIYKVRHGDKKDLVKEIVELRRAVEKSMTYKRFSDALIDYQHLCEKLEEHLRRPHIYFLQARSGIAHCVWNLYCTQFPELPILDDGEYASGNRDHAKFIYNNNMTETASDNSGMDLGPTEKVNFSENACEANKTSLYESTRKLLEQSSQKVSNAVSETKENKEKLEQEKAIALELLNEHQQINDRKDTVHQNGQSESTKILVDNGSISNVNEQEREELIKRKQYEKEIMEKEQMLRAEKRKQWAAEEKERAAKEEERKAKRKKECQEKLKKEQEREEAKRKQKKIEEELKIKQKQEEFEKMMTIERAKRQKQEEDRQKKKQEEDEELQKLLMEIGDDFEIDATLEEEYTQESSVNEMNSQVQSEHKNQDSSKEMCLVNSRTDAINDKNESSRCTSVQSVINIKEEVPDLTQGITFSKNAPIEKGEQEVKQLSNGVIKMNENAEPANVWSSLRKIRENESEYKPLFSSNKNESSEIASIDDIDDMIKDLAQKIADKRHPTSPQQKGVWIKPELNSVSEDCEVTLNDEKYDNSTNEKQIINNNNGIDIIAKPFDYDIWKSEMDTMFQQTEDPMERKAADELYLQNLRQKIQTNVNKVNKSNKSNKDKEKIKDHISDKNEGSPIPKRKDDFAILKLKEKERKKKKNDAKFQQKVEDNTDKMKEMSLKTQKIEKISMNSQEEIQKIRAMANKLIAKSEAKENEFKEIFLNLDNIGEVLIETDKKKGKKGKKKKEDTKISALSDEVHWTEEDKHKWESNQKGDSKVSNVLAALKAAALNGQSNFVADSLKSTIDNCRKMEQDAEDERIQEKERRLEEEKKRKEAELKAKREKENEVKKRDEIKAAQDRKIKTEEDLKRKKKVEEEIEAKRKKEEEEEAKRKQEEEKETKRKQEEEKRTLEKQNKQNALKREQEILEKEKLKEIKLETEKIKEEQRKQKEKMEREEKERKQRQEKAREEELLRKQKTMALQKAYEEKERQRIEEEEELERIKDLERLKRQEDFLEKMKLEEERKRKEIQIKLEEERKQIEEQKAREQKTIEQKKIREEEGKKREIERKMLAEKKHKQEMEKKKQDQEKKLREEQDKRDREARAIKEEREAIEKLLNGRKNIEEEEESMFKDKIGHKESVPITTTGHRKTEEHIETREITTEKLLQKEAVCKKESSLDYATTQKIQNGDSNVSHKPPKINNAQMNGELINKLEEEKTKLMKLNKEIEQLDKNEKSVSKKPPRPTTERIPLLKENKNSNIVTNDKTAGVITVDSNSFMPKKNTKSEVQILKIGSPSQIRKAVMCEVKVDEPLTRIDNDNKRMETSAQNNYQISKVPTTTFEFKRPKPQAENKTNYEITKVPTTNANIELEKLTKAYAENVVKYSDTKPTRKRSQSASRPPPPSFKPPPPPPIF